MNRDHLLNLIQCHSTPGDEDQVRDMLRAEWTQTGRATALHGPYAISATQTGAARQSRPCVLVCAHMDSPGFAVESRVDGELQVVPLGGAHFEATETPARLKTRSGICSVTLRQIEQDNDRPLYRCENVPEADYGDRICYAPDSGFDGTRITAPFLDNRLGCAALLELASRDLGDAQVVLGATACEELGGFGAPVLARAIQPDLVLCLDATYEDVGQEVHCGAGPVLTLSDASVLLSCRTRDRVQQICTDAGVPLQTEVYNYSGTDARAFPHQGLPCTVLPLLIPTRGNHTPAEEADLRDMDHLLDAIAAIIVRADDLV